MFVYRRPVRFHEIDAAGFVFFPTFLVWAHEAMELCFAPLEGGYRGLIVERKVGLPAVRLETEFLSPLRYGDVARIELAVRRIGTRSLTLGYAFFRGETAQLTARLEHTVVTTDLTTAKSCDMPEDVRHVAQLHVVRSAQERR